MAAHSGWGRHSITHQLRAPAMQMRVVDTMALGNVHSAQRTVLPAQRKAAL